MNADLGIIIAIIAASVTISASMIAMFLWQRSEANSDRRHFQLIQSEDRKDILNLIRAIEDEIKDFHYRLLEVERNK